MKWPQTRSFGEESKLAKEGDYVECLGKCEDETAGRS